MAIFYHDSPPGFFDSSTVAPPPGSVEISVADRSGMHASISEGYSYLIDKGIVVRQEKPAQSIEQLSDLERIWRKGEISSTDWVVIRHRDEIDWGIETTIGAEKLLELLEYRQQLRDWPEHSHFPDALHRPQPRDWMSEVKG
ncbi:phage tail assembly chaperone [Pseudomonas sp. BRM28]|uniref:phage tail assembly chaperone n=1 Tax=Pseudomonas sp. BRM28 TaxID=2045201 RepID=UPI0011AFF5D4|nr:phage tail assembly chaperone [Pseudomonas sp. BRM28]